MIDYKLLVGLTSLFAVWISLAYIDHKYRFRLLDWMNGEVDNPFSKKEQATNKSIDQKDKEIASLKKRIEVLEKVVTEPAYELNQKLNKL